MTTRPMNPDAALPIGIEIGEHAIEAVVATGDTGFVYLASDPLLARQVAIKEYFPPELAVRHAGTQMRARSASEHRTVMAGRDAFVEESRLLARIDHPALVRVVGAYEAHQTAYRVMPFHAGPTLAQARAERGVPPGDLWLRSMIDELLGALEALHAAGIVHGHLHPAQVLLRSDDRPLLLGFGAAARVLRLPADAGYAPPELSAVGHQLQRGPWTDLYSLGALSWFAVMGEAPPAARPLDFRAAFDAAFGPVDNDDDARSRERLCDALARALETPTAARPQSVAEMRALLDDRPAAAAEASQAELPPEPDPRIRAAIAAAVASIPDVEPKGSAAPTAAGRPAGARESASRPSVVPARPVANASPAARPFEPAFTAATQDAERGAGRQSDPAIPPLPANTAGPGVSGLQAGRMPRTQPVHTQAARGMSEPQIEPRSAPLSRYDRAAPSDRAHAVPPSEPVLPWVGAAPAAQPSFERAASMGEAPAVGNMAPEAKAQRPQPARAAWVGQRLDGGRADAPPAGDGALPSWMADRPAEAEAVRKPALRPRRTGLAWVAALVVGVAVGGAAWRWSEERNDAAARAAAGPAPAERPAQTPPAVVRPLPATDDPATPAPDATTTQSAQVPDPSRVPPPAAGEPAAPSVEPGAIGAPVPPVAEVVAPQALPPRAAAPESQAGGSGGDGGQALAAVPTEQPSRSPRAAPRPATPRLPARRPTVAATPPAPRAVCGNRTNFSLVYCMQQQCRRPNYSAHPQCREFRRTGEVN